MKHGIYGALAACILCSLAIAATAAAPTYETEYTNETPLIVIRFNQPHVMYERPLYNVISQALEAKPSATFDIVSISVQTRDSRNQQYNNQLATANTHKVLATLQEMGLPQSRINLTSAADNVSASEVRIFVH